MRNGKHMKWMCSLAHCPDLAEKSISVKSGQGIQGRERASRVAGYVEERVFKEKKRQYFPAGSRAREKARREPAPDAVRSLTGSASHVY